MNRNLYVLEGKEPRAAESVIEWMRWYADAQRVIARTAIGSVVDVATVFLSIAPKAKATVDGEAEHGRRIPALFETTAFVGEGGSFERLRLVRSKTWTEAEAAHAFIVEQIQEAASSSEQQVRAAVLNARDIWLSRRLEGE